MDSVALEWRQGEERKSIPYHKMLLILEKQPKFIRFLQSISQESYSSIKNSYPFYQHLSIEETVKFTAEVSLDNPSARVESILRLFNLDSHARCTRDLASFICKELVNDPRLLFIENYFEELGGDESIIILAALRSYALSERCTIVVSMSQVDAELAQIFDEIWIDDKRFGAPEETFRLLKSHSNNDLILDLDESFEQAALPVYNHVAAILQKPSIWFIFIACLVRAVKITVRHHALVYGNLAITLFVSLMAAFLFFQIGDEYWAVRARSSLAFFLSVDAMIGSSSTFVSILDLDRRVMIQEQYRGAACDLVSRFIVLACFVLLYGTLSDLIVYWIAGLRPEFHHFITFWFTMSALRLAALSLVFMLNSLITSVFVRQTLLSFYLFLCLIFAGAYATAKKPTWILRWIQYISLLYYSYPTILQNELKDRSFSTTLQGNDFIPSNLMPIVPAILTLLGMTLVFLFVSLLVVMTRVKK